MTLDSGNSDNFYWRIFFRIEDNGKFRTRGSITTWGKEEQQERSDKWKGNHPEQVCDMGRQYYVSHKDEISERCKKYNESHKEEKQQYAKDYYYEHSDEFIERSYKWKKDNPERFRLIDKRCQAKRKRGLGFIPVNEPFKGANGHHFNKNGVIYIPGELHRSILHNVFTGKNMEKINKAAFEWLDRELIRVAFEKLKLTNEDLGGDKSENA